MVSQSTESVQVINHEEFDLAMQRKALAKKKKMKSGSSSFHAFIWSLAMISQQAFNLSVLHPDYVSQCADGASWVLSHVLGTGASATVYLAHKLTDGVGYELPSLLVIKSAHIEHVDIFSDEEKMLRRVANINVVNCYGRLMSYSMNTNVKKMSNLLLEYCCGGSLATYIRDNGRLSEEYVQIFAHGILSIVCVCSFWDLVANSGDGIFVLGEKEYSSFEFNPEGGVVDQYHGFFESSGTIGRIIDEYGYN